MTTIALPSTAAFQAAKFEAGYDANVFASQSPLDGSVQTVNLPGDRFRARLTLPAATSTDRADVEGFFASLRPSQSFSANRLQCHHLARPAPRGTLRGSPTLQASAAQLATTISIQTTAAATLLRGDLISLGGQTVMVTADATANGSGVMSATISPALRAAVSSSSAITWDKPTFLWLIVGMPMWGYEPGYVSQSVTMELMEVFA